MKKPPAFQLYVKDWRSSPLVRSMTATDRGIFITLLTAAWDTERPGCLPNPFAEKAHRIRTDVAQMSHRCRTEKARFERIVEMRWATCARFLAKYPTTFKPDGDWLVNEKLHQQFLGYQELSEKRKAAANARFHPKNDAIAAAEIHAIASTSTMQVDMQKPYSASASATAKLTTTPLPPAGAGGNVVHISRYHEVVAVEMGRRKRLPNLDSTTGANAHDLAAYLTRSGFPARVVAHE